MVYVNGLRDRLDSYVAQGDRQDFFYDPEDNGVGVVYSTWKDWIDAGLRVL